jgi:hypothetical protein
MLIQSKAKRSNRSSAIAAAVSATGPCGRQPTTSPQPRMAASPITELSMSATLRPTSTADGAIGSDRNRSVTPFAASSSTATIVVDIPKSMVMPNMPGIRKSR